MGNKDAPLRTQEGNKRQEQEKKKQKTDVL